MDYTDKMYWPVRGPEFHAERRTTYGQTIAASYHIHSSQTNTQRPHTVKLEPVARPPGSRMLSRRTFDETVKVKPFSPSYNLDSSQMLYKFNRIRGLESRVPLARDTKSRSKYAVTLYSSNQPEGDEIKLRHGRAGGTWRHVKEVLQGHGGRMMFIDGQTTLEDRIANLTPRLKSIERPSSLPGPVASGLIQKGDGHPLTVAEVQGMQKANWTLLR